MQEAGVGTDESGRRLLGSNTVAGVAVQGDLGWRKLEEQREEIKVLLGKRLKGMEESQLVKMVEKLSEDGGGFEEKV